MHNNHEGHCHDHDHCHDHCHDHHHDHSHEAPAQPPMTALLAYMLDHNQHHAAELEELAGQLKEKGMTEAAEKILGGVADFQAGNEKLAAALEMVKNA